MHRADAGCHPRLLGDRGQRRRSSLLLIAYSLGLGIPFILLALAIDNAARFTRPILKYGRQIELVGGALVVMIGLAILFDWLAFFSGLFSTAAALSR